MKWEKRQKRLSWVDISSSVDAALLKAHHEVTWREARDGTKEKGPCEIPGQPRGRAGRGVSAVTAWTFLSPRWNRCLQQKSLSTSHHGRTELWSPPERAAAAPETQQLGLRLGLPAPWLGETNLCWLQMTSLWCCVTAIAMQMGRLRWGLRVEPNGITHIN